MSCVTLRVVDRAKKCRAANNHDGRMRIDFAMKEKHFLVNIKQGFHELGCFHDTLLLLVLINIIILEQF